MLEVMVGGGGEGGGSNGCGKGEINNACILTAIIKSGPNDVAGAAAVRVKKIGSVGMSGIIGILMGIIGILAGIIEN